MEQWAIVQPNMGALGDNGLQKEHCVRKCVHLALLGCTVC